MLNGKFDQDLFINAFITHSINARCGLFSLRSHLCVFQGKPGGLGSTGEKGPPGQPVSMMSSDVVKLKLCCDDLALVAVDRVDA